MGASSGTDRGVADVSRSFELDGFACRRAAVDRFVDRHFTWPGTFCIHRAAIGCDILRAPVNVVLSLLLVLIRIVAFVARLAGLHHFANWLMARQILLRTSVARRVETLVLTDLLDLPGGPDGADRGRPALAAAIVSAPWFRAMHPADRPAEAAEAIVERILRDVREYASARTAVAEMTTTLMVIIVGAIVFQALTPGMISMAPDVAGAAARMTAIADFPLGQRLGGAWYSVFAPKTPAWLVSVAVAGLIAIGATFSAFAGILADPFQARFGIHRRRLMRLLGTIERHCMADADSAFVAREHFLARILDFWDAFIGVLRIFRG